MVIFLEPCSKKITITGYLPTASLMLSQWSPGECIEEVDTFVPNFFHLTILLFVVVMARHNCVSEPFSQLLQPFDSHLLWLYTMSCEVLNWLVCFFHTNGHVMSQYFFFIYLKKFLQFCFSDNIGICLYMNENQKSKSNISKVLWYINIQCSTLQYQRA